MDSREHWNEKWQSEPPTDDGGPRCQTGGIWVVTNRPPPDLLDHGFTLTSSACVFSTKQAAVWWTVWDQIVSKHGPLTWDNSAPWFVLAWDNTGDWYDSDTRQYAITYQEINDTDDYDQPEHFPEVVAEMARLYPALMLFGPTVAQGEEAR